MIYTTMGVDRQTMEKKAGEILEQMTLKEKIWLLNGNWNVVEFAMTYNDPYNPVPIETNGCERLGVPPIAFSDGPRGVVMGESTCFPVSMARGATFDRELEKRVGDVIGKECRAQGANYFAGVCINLLRHPAWGRAQETYGEDPYHVGEFGLALTKAVQHHKVMACVKHYAVNNIENARFRTDVTFDSQRTLHEVYLPHFKKCVVDGAAASLMGAYNKMEGDQACESYKLQTEILRDMWGFEGFVSSDFLFGIRDTKKAIEAGMDVEMPMPVHYQQKLLKMVEEGNIDQKYVDQSAHRVIRTLLAFTANEDKYNYGKHMVQSQENILLAREVAEKGMVLLKNDNSVLPLAKNIKSLLVVGDSAKSGCVGDEGSSAIKRTPTVTHLQGLENYFGDTVEITHCSEKELDKAKDLAKSVDTVLIVAGLDFTDEGEYLVPDKDVDLKSIISEGLTNLGRPELAAHTGGQEPEMPVASDEEGKGFGGDRAKLGLRNSQVAAIKALAGINPNTVVSVVSGSMIDIAPWHSDVPAIVQNWYAGQECGNAWARILFGDVNPSGKLPFSIVADVDQDLCPFDNTIDEAFYEFHHGYTLLDKDSKQALYPFGYGLSYTTFNISGHTAELFDDRIRVTVDVTNTGAVEGGEVVQVYVGAERSAVERHHKLLKGFEKIYLKAGETKTVNVDVMLSELEYFDEAKAGFVLEHTDYQLFIGNSSDQGSLVKLEVSCK